MRWALSTRERGLPTAAVFILFKTCMIQLTRSQHLPTIADPICLQLSRPSLECCTPRTRHLPNPYPTKADRCSLIEPLSTPHLEPNTCLLWQIKSEFNCQGGRPSLTEPCRAAHLQLSTCPMPIPYPSKADRPSLTEPWTDVHQKLNTCLL